MQNQIKHIFYYDYIFKEGKLHIIIVRLEIQSKGKLSMTEWAS